MSPASQDIAAIDRLRSAIEQADPQLFGWLRVGVSSDRMRELVHRYLVEAVPWIDETIKYWWSWHDGLRLDGSVSYYAAHLSPGGLVLERLEAVLERKRLSLEVAEMEGQYFPLSADQHGGGYVLRRPTSSDAWQIWHMTKESELYSVGEPLERVLFADYLDALTDAITARVLVRPDPLSGFDNEDRSLWEYPWR